MKSRAKSDKHREIGYGEMSASVIILGDSSSCPFNSRDDYLVNYIPSVRLSAHMSQTIINSVDIFT